MLSFTQAAIEFIQTKQDSVYLDIPPLIGCCVHLKESPSVRFGKPYNPETYDERIIQGVNVFVPHELPDQPLTVTLSSFLGFKKLVVEGWHLA